MTSLSRTLRFLLALGGFSLAMAAWASAADRAALNACYSPSALAAVPGEEIAAKGNHTYDAPTKLAGVTAGPAVPDGLRGAIRRVDVPKGKKVIALTFDLCEQRGEVAGYEGRIFDYLRAQGVKATFFAGGKWMASHQERTKQLMLDPLFEIGNHTETHRNLRLVSPEVLRQEVLAPMKVYEDTRARLASNQCVAGSGAVDAQVPSQPRVFRFPYGACNDASLKAVNDAGMVAIQWDVATGDPDPHESATRIANAMIHEAKSGSIIVNHANGRGWHTPEALTIAIPQLKAKGYTFVTVSELMAMGKPVVVSECYDRKPGDTNRYDFLGALTHQLNPGQSATAKLAAVRPAATPLKPQPDKAPKAAGSGN
jgi:peptidoglycan/xylan/chitin deacetylase (PgdA/CDA1 family)